MLIKTEKKCLYGQEFEILATYPAEAYNYRNTRLMYIMGKQDARPGTVGTIVSPQQAKGVIIDSGIPDVKSFSFTWQGELRQLLVKINSSGGSPSTCTIRLVKPCAGGKWESLSGDVSVVSDTGISLLANPHGLAQWGDLIFLIDYESKRIVILGADELEGMSGDYFPLKTPFSLSGQLPDNAKGQAIIILDNTLYALYLVSTTSTAYQPGVICRVNIGSNGTLAFDTRTTVGLNPQSIIPVQNATGAIQLLIPAIGGPQKSDGTSNGTLSNVCCVPAIGPWPVIADINATAAQILVTGDAGASPLTAYDIHALAAGTRGPANMLYILAQIYSASGQAKWTLYAITVGDFLALTGSPTLSTATKLTKIDEGTVNSDATPGGIYFWDLLYAQTDEVSDAGDLLWVALGTPILVTRAASGGYGAPDSTKENAYLMFGFNGGNNVNAIDLTIETLNEEKRGGLSLKRGLYGSVYTGNDASK